MTKYRAEHILKLTNAYMLSDVKKAYRDLVKVCHPDMGGNQDEMIELNRAYEYMLAMFNGNKNATYSCETVDSTAYNTSNTNYSNAGQTNTAYNQANNTYANTTSNASSGSTSTANASNGYAAGNYANASSRATTSAENIDDAFNAAAAAAVEADKARFRTISKPVWWKFLDAFERHFPWRFAFLGLGLFMMFSVTVALWELGSAMYIHSVVIMLASFVNLLTGLLTDPLRKSFRWLLGELLNAHTRRKMKASMHKAVS